MRRLLGLGGLVVVFVAMLAGCGRGAAVKDGCDASHALHWDLSEGHTIEDVEWPNDLTAFQLRDGVDVLLRLPGGAVFDECADFVSGIHRDGVVAQINVAYPAATTEDAYTLAVGLSDVWNVDTVNLDDWFARRMSQREAGSEDFTDTAATGGPPSEPAGGPCGPAPVIEALNSFDGERPVRVNFSWVWPRYDRGADTQEPLPCL